MVHPVPSHPPAAVAPEPAAPEVPLVAVRPPAWAAPSTALCHARAAPPARDRLLAVAAAPRPVQLARTGAAAEARTAAPRRSTPAGAGHAGAIASAVASAVKAAAKAGVSATATTTAKKTAKKTTASTSRRSTGALAFLDDKALTTDEKLMRLLVYLQSRWQKDIEKRLKEIAATGARKASSGGTSRSSSGGGGLLGKVVKAAASFVPGASAGLSLLADPQAQRLVSQVSGPVLAAGVTAAGFPALAPLALTLGPQAVDALASVARDADGSAARSTSSGGSSSGSASTSDLSPDAAEKIQLMELQRVMEHQKELFSMVSNMLRSGHDLRMNVIHNLR